MTDVIASDDKREIELCFALSLEDGQCIDGNIEGPSVRMTLGDGNLPHGFEKCLVGMQADQHEQFKVPPEDAFGQRNDQNLQVMPRQQFRDDLGIEKGLVVSFTDPSGGHLPGVIFDWNDDEVTVDFNHPLAGKSLLFDVKIVALHDADS